MIVPITGNIHRSVGLGRRNAAIREELNERLTRIRLTIASTNEKKDTPAHHLATGRCAAQEGRSSPPASRRVHLPRNMPDKTIARRLTAPPAAAASRTSRRICA